MKRCKDAKMQRHKVDPPSADLEGIAASLPLVAPRNDVEGTTDEHG